MTSHTPLPVKGYVAQSDQAISLVNENKEIEERLLRRIESLQQLGQDGDGREVDRRWLAIAKTHIEEGFMALNRAIFQPQRAKLPEDQ